MRNRYAGLALVLLLVSLAAVPVFAASATANVTFSVVVTELGLSAHAVPFESVTPASMTNKTVQYPHAFITITGADVAALTVQADVTGLSGWTMSPRGAGESFHLDPSFTDQIYLWISLGEPDGAPHVIYWSADGIVPGSPKGTMTNAFLKPGNYGGIGQLLVGPRSAGAANVTQTIVLTWTATAQ